MQLSVVCLQNALSVSIFLFHFMAPKTISLLQKTKSIPIKLCILDSIISEYELPDLPKESDSDLPDVTIPKQYKYCKFGESSTKGDNDKRICKEPPSTSSTAQSIAESSEVGHDNQATLLKHYYRLKSKLCLQTNNIKIQHVSCSTYIFNHIIPKSYNN